MAWWEKAAKSVRDQAEKVSFEADKQMRIHRAESAVNQLKSGLQGKLVELGQAALALQRSGALNDPALASLAGEIGALEAQIQEQETGVEAVRAEQWQPAAAQPATAPEGGAQAAPEPVAEAPAERPSAPAAEAPAAETVNCPNCQAAVSPKAAFCTECGARLR